MRLTLHLPLLLLCALSISACTSSEKAREAEDKAREIQVALAILDVNEELGVPKVQCPDNIDADEGSRYRCVARAADGTSVAVNVLQPGNAYTNVTISTKLLETSKFEMFLRHDLDAGRPSEGLSLRDRYVRQWYARHKSLILAGVDVGRPPDPVVGLLDCQDLVEIKQGRHFTCKGTTILFDFTVHATFANDRGMFNYTVRPS